MLSALEVYICRCYSWAAIKHNREISTCVPVDVASKDRIAGEGNIRKLACKACKGCAANESECLIVSKVYVGIDIVQINSVIPPD